MLEKWNKIVDPGGVFDAVLTDLSRASGCISHEFLIANLEEYGFQTNTLNLVHMVICPK